MGLFGAIVGGGIGTMIGGPIGGIIGAVLGGTAFSSSRRAAGNTQQAQVAFFICFFSCLAKLAKADGVVTQEEIDFVEELMDEHFHLDPGTKDLAKKVFIEAKDNSTPASAYVEQFGQIVNYDRELCMMLVGTLFELSKRDGKSTREELDIIEDAKRILRLNSSGYGERGSYGSAGKESGKSYSRAGSSTELREAYELLEVEESMSDGDIKRKYRQKCADFHPDKLQSKGLPEEFMKFATEQMTKINKAYDLIMKSRA